MDPCVSAVAGSSSTTTSSTSSSTSTRVHRGSARELAALPDADSGEEPKHKVVVWARSRKKDLRWRAKAD
eukprot:3125142-Alexandrium_andersonii.AAC.1